MRRFALLAAGVLALATSVPAMAISDGDYSYTKQGCKGNSLDSDRPAHTEKYCYTATLQLADRSHRYVLVGVPTTPDGTFANSVDICIDLTGVNKCVNFSQSGPTPLPDRPGTPIDPAGGQIHAYFGADDNLDNGEHDGSEYVENGPSDGGSVQANADAFNIVTWMQSITDTKYLLTHPLPILDGGTGACADGICFSLQTVRRVAYKSGAGKKDKPRDVSDYEGHEWDPPACGGPTDTAKDCGGHNLGWWHNRNQTAYVEPGIQIYEDPDPQGSPLDPYPLPALYVGTCGFVAGGGAAPAFPASPITNKAGQLILKTGC